MERHTEPPEISVIVPVLNEGTRLERNFRSLNSQVGAPSYEIIYIDNLSTDDSWTELLDLARGRDDVRVHRMKRREPVGKLRAMAVNISRGEIIGNIDADCIVPPDWLSHSVALEGQTGVIGFPVVPPTDLEYLHHRFGYEGTGQYSPGQMPHGPGALLQKDLVLKAGNFPPLRLGEDTSLFARISTLGGEIRLLDAPVIHLIPKRTTLVSHLRRYFFMGSNAGLNSRLLYSGMIVAVASLIFMAVFIGLTNPWLAIGPTLAAYGLLTNPRRIAFYVRNFKLPRNVLLRAGLFAVTKTAETLSILAGFIYSIVHPERPGPRLNPEYGERKG